VTTDAINCKRGIAEQIMDQGGDYVLALKSLLRRNDSTSPHAGTNQS
jgi:predicted transposase YbfD/YdcC